VGKRSIERWYRHQRVFIPNYILPAVNWAAIPDTLTFDNKVGTVVE